MVTSLSFKNFKSWKCFPEMKFGSLTAFFGTNSSGKTSILDFLLLLKQTLESTDRSQVLDFGGQNSYTELGSFNDLIYNHELSEGLEFTIALSFLKSIDIYDTETRKTILFSNNQMSFSSLIKQTAAKRLFVQEFNYTFSNRKFIMRKKEKDRYDYSLTSDSNNGEARYPIKRTVGRGWPLPEPIKFHGFPDQIRTYYQNTGFLFDLQLALEEFFANIYYLGPLREYPKRQYTWTGTQPIDMGRRGERCIEALLSSREQGIKISRGKRKKKFTVEEYVAYWLKELGLIYEFSISEISESTNIYQVKVKRNKDSPFVLLTDVGFGVSQILPVLTICYYVAEGSTLLIEQPEIHLHPNVQAGLADVFIDAIEKKRIQIILESHSEHLLRRLQRRIAEERIRSNQIKAFFSENSGKESKLIPLDVDLFGNIRNWPSGFFGDEMGEIAAMTKAIRERKTRDE